MVDKLENVHKHALNRYREADAFCLENNKEARDDLMMLAGKNHWPKTVYDARTRQDRPCLTINKLPSFTDQIINDSRMNKLSVKVKPDGAGTNPDTARIMQGIIRNIESSCNAQTIYETALECAVQSGIGYWRIITEYSDDDSFDLDIKIKRVRDQFSIVMDPRAEEVDKRDARYAFVTEKISEDEYKAKYPGEELPVDIPGQTGASETNLWVEENLYRIAEYWVRKEVEKKLYLLSDGRTVMAEDWDKIKDDLKAQEKVIHLAPSPENPQVPVEVEGPAPEGSGLPEETLNRVPTIMRNRTVKTHAVEQYVMDGAKIIEGPTEWPGRWIPIVCITGKEIVVDNEVFIRSAIRFAKDPQRLYNYFRSSAAETVALAPKAPYIMEEEQVEGHETEWQAIGKENRPYLLYKRVDGTPPPNRQVVSQTAIGEITEAQMANDEMKATTSLFDASLGAQGNETSGRAILARQREGDVANFTFHDNLRRGVKFGGEIIMDLVPKIFDVERQLVVVGDDGDEKVVTVNQVVVNRGSGEEVIIYDLTQGKYKLQVDVGPSFTTQRVEAAESMLDFIRVAPDSAQLVIDLVAENMDWPGATKIAKRFKKILEQQFPGIDEEGPSQPKPPDPDEQIKGLKAQSISLGNKKKELDIAQLKAEMQGVVEQAAAAGAKGALQGIGMIPPDEEE